MNPVLLFAALLPAVILLIRVYRLDKIEKEPPRVLLKLVAIGALSGFVAAAAETALTQVLDLCFRYQSVLYLIIENFLIVAGVEEFCKRFPVHRFLWNDPAFNYRFDAVVYCVFSALGFAALENIFYVAQYGLGTALVRALLSVPGHFFFAVYMGIYLGEAKKAESCGNLVRREHFLRCSFWVPMLLHGFWDFCLSFESTFMTILFYVFVLVFFLHTNRLLRRSAQSDEPLDGGYSGL